MVKLHYYGHSAFMFSYKDIPILLVDPFLTNNPWEKQKASDVECDFILVSHAHSDHLGDTIEIAKRTQATVISTAEIANLCVENDVLAHSMHIGGKYNFPFGWVRVTQAFHGSGISGGHACGFIFSFYGKTIYFAGDTGIFGDMELLGQLEAIDYALLPIGDNFTMGPSDAALAAKLLNPKKVIPMHYQTWPIIDQDPEKYKQLTESKYKIPVQVVLPGEIIKL